MHYIKRLNKSEIYNRMKKYPSFHAPRYPLTFLNLILKLSNVLKQYIELSNIYIAYIYVCVYTDISLIYLTNPSH